MLVRVLSWIVFISKPTMRSTKSHELSRTPRIDDNLPNGKCLLLGENLLARPLGFLPQLFQFFQRRLSEFTVLPADAGFDVSKPAAEFSITKFQSGFGFHVQAPRDVGDDEKQIANLFPDVRMVRLGFRVGVKADRFAQFFDLFL